MVIALVAPVLLFWHLDAKYLWQDEAATAVLGERLMKFGKPLAYDGKNLITLDHFVEEGRAALEERTADPAAAVRYYVARGDFRADTTWTAQPWGQFLAAGASLAAFGRTTGAARAPFALAGLATVLLLFFYARKQFDDALLACLASGLLLANIFWLLHARQCRYYSLSSLFLVTTLVAFSRWQSGKRWGAPLFVASGWCFFQMDYGAFWPVIGVMLGAAAWSARASGVRAASADASARRDRARSVDIDSSAQRDPARVAGMEASARQDSAHNSAVQSSTRGERTRGSGASAPDDDAVIAPARSSPRSDSSRLGVAGSSTRPRPHIGAVAAAAACLAASVAPWVWYYGLFTRLRKSGDPWSARLVGNLFNFNQFVLPLTIFVAIGGVLWLSRTKLAGEKLRTLAVCTAIVAGLPIWATVFAPHWFLRYLVASIPIASLLAAWFAVRAGSWIARGSGSGTRRAVAAAAVALALAISPLPSNLVTWLIPRFYWTMPDVGTVFRPELRLFASEILGDRPDPNRAVVEWVKARAGAVDEILVNYEDVPFMFYLGSPVRGGIPCFRVEDSGGQPPKFAVLRQSVRFVPGSPFKREMDRYRWQQIKISVPDIPWGNNPDPAAQALWYPNPGSGILIAVREEQ